VAVAVLVTRSGYEAPSNRGRGKKFWGGGGR
jgi:hypothetical protein